MAFVEQFFPYGAVNTLNISAFFRHLKNSTKILKFKIFFFQKLYKRCDFTSKRKNLANFS